MLVLVCLILFGVLLRAQELARDGRGEVARSSASAHHTKQLPYAPGSILVRMRSRVTKAQSARAHALAQASMVRAFAVVPGLQLVRVAEGASMEEALRAYRSDPNVLYAEPDYIVHALTDVTPNDPSFLQQYALSKIGAPTAWGYTTGSSQVVVGVIDTGVDYTHEDLSANMFRNEADCNSNGIDDDGNGYIDDCYGIDPANNDSNPMDDVNHGTHVAGIIGAVGNNGLGVVGVNWQVKIVACKFLTPTGGTTSDAIRCLDYMAALKQHGVNVVATNNSWGGESYSQAMFDAIGAQRQLGILFIAAAGNDGIDSDPNPQYPANYEQPNVIAVASTDSSDSLSSFSDYGRTTVHLGAPGSGILSTLPGNSYGNKSGTSMSTPYVTGAAALLKADDPARDWRAIKNLLLAGGDPITALAGKTITGNRLNLPNAMRCSNRSVFAPLQPHPNERNAVVGLPVTFSALNINCAASAGPVDVAISPDGGHVTLTDDGVTPDVASSDGIVSGNWVPPSAGTRSFTFPNASPFDVQVLSPYSFQSVPMELRQFSGTILATNGADDDRIDNISSPFPILLGGGSFNTLSINTNGVIGLNGVPQYWPYADDQLPYQAAGPLIAPLWLDLITLPADSAQTSWGVLGSAPARELVVEWKNVAFYRCACNGLSYCASPQSNGAVVTFQVVFFEGQSKVLFNYPDIQFGGSCTEADFGREASIGIQVTPSVATQAFPSSVAGLANGTALLWDLGTATPSVSGLLPFSAIAGGAGFTLKVEGLDFAPASVVQWNGSARQTTFINSRELDAQVTAADISSVGSAQVRVFTSAGQITSDLPFAIYATNPVPVLTSVSPSPVYTTVDPTSDLTLTGTGFVAGAKVYWDGVLHSSLVNSSTSAVMHLRTGDTTAATHSLTIENPVPGGGLSNALSVPVTYDLPLSLSRPSRPARPAGSSSAAQDLSSWICPSCGVLLSDASPAVGSWVPLMSVSVLTYFPVSLTLDVPQPMKEKSDEEDSQRGYRLPLEPRR